jgi:hypothetical protein
MWGFFAVGFVGMACAIGWLLRRYAAPSVPYIVLVTTAYAWAVSMSIVLITPIDVWAALKHQPERGISILWRITYWSTQVSKCRLQQSTAYAGAPATRSVLPASIAAGL